MRDVHHDAVFPQPPLPEAKFECPAGQVLCAPNPCLLRIGGVTVGATAADVLKHMAAAETARETDKRTDRMVGQEESLCSAFVNLLSRPRKTQACSLIVCCSSLPPPQSRLAAHLVGQRSFYPLTPAAVGTCLDSSLAPVRGTNNRRRACRAQLRRMTGSG